MLMSGKIMLFFVFLAFCTNHGMVLYWLALSPHSKKSWVQILDSIGIFHKILSNFVPKLESLSSGCHVLPQTQRAVQQQVYSFYYKERVGTLQTSGTRGRFLYRNRAGVSIEQERRNQKWLWIFLVCILRAGSDWFDVKHMECGINYHGSRQLDTSGKFIDYFCQFQKGLINFSDSFLEEHFKCLWRRAKRSDMDRDHSPLSVCQMTFLVSFSEECRFGCPHIFFHIWGSGIGDAERRERPILHLEVETVKAGNQRELQNEIY